jgi:ribosomal protein S18 acetylase RimI-like enzyme
MELRKLQLLECSKVAKLHLEAFPSFFLTSFGNSFLKTFYTSMLKHPDGIYIGLFDKQNIVAFAVGASKKRGFYTAILKKNGLILILKSLPFLLKSPNKLVRLLKALKTKDTNDDKILDSATLLSICVSPKYRDKGIGNEILKAFEEIAFQTSKGISLTTDAINNDYVNNYYKKNGYSLLKQFEQGTRKMNLYYKERNV